LNYNVVNVTLIVCYWMKLDHVTNDNKKKALKVGNKNMINNWEA